MQSQQTLEDFLSVENEYQRASVGQRFGNFLVDLLIFYVIMFVVGIILAFTSPSAIEALNNESAGFNLIDRIVSLILYAIYMALVEGISRGKSLGKMITGTRAVNLDGSKISFGTAFVRGFSRAVPFEAFSAFGGNPWHDKWSDTMVVIDRKNK